MTTGFVACGNDENDNTLVPTTPTNNNGSTSTNDTVPTIDVNNLDFKMAYADKWANYMSIVSGLLKDDATTLYNEWNDRYADYFKAHNSDEYLSALNCVDQILDGCKEIASEVGASKIGEPYNYWVDGDREAAVYAVESWYSWHSREDYRNNIYSIRNAYYGTRDGSISPNSLSALLAKKNPELDQQAKEAIQNAADAIWDIPQPFRNNISTIETVAAMLACAELEEFIDKELKPYFNDNIKTDEELDPIVRQYVDVVVLPTYKDLMNKNIALDNAEAEKVLNIISVGFNRVFVPGRGKIKPEGWHIAHLPTSRKLLEGFSLETLRGIYEKCDIACKDAILANLPQLAEDYIYPYFI